MSNFYLKYKLCILIFLGLSFLVHGNNNEESTIYTKWPLCECIPTIKKDVHYEILTKDSQEHLEFHTSFHDGNIATYLNFSTIKSGDERKLIFENYPIEKFEPFIYQYDNDTNWHGFQYINIGKKYRSPPSFKYTINCENHNNIHILMPLIHGCIQLPEVFKKTYVDVDGSVGLKKFKKKKLIINCKAIGEFLELDIQIPVKCANFNINLLDSPLIMHLHNKYFSGSTKRSITIKKTNNEKVIVTFFINDKQPEKVTTCSKSIFIWRNNKSESYELTTKDFADNKVKFTHTNHSKNESDEQELNKQNLSLLSQQTFTQQRKRTVDNTELTDKTKTKKISVW